MPKVLIKNHSTFYDTKRKVQFNPLLDRRSGCFVGVADVDTETAETYEGHPHFQVLTDEEYLEMVTVPSDPVPVEPNTGDPLGDAAAKPKTQTRRPPVPPRSK